VLCDDWSYYKCVKFSILETGYFKGPQLQLPDCVVQRQCDFRIWFECKENHDRGFADRGRSTTTG
jgi:hypothetical protein